MKKIATLGPKGTYSDTATRRYLKTKNEQFEVEYNSSIKKVLKSIGNTAEFGVLPVENLSEGYISLVLDHLINTNLFIVGEIVLPIQFSFVSRKKNLSELERIFTQFVAKGQCSEFIESFGDIKLIDTESNIISLEMMRKNTDMSGAIVPSNSFDPNDFPLVIENINDYKNNQTRFLVLSSNEIKPQKEESKKYKTSILVLDDNDYPGFLSDILISFSSREINLTSIISRPARRALGKYHFFIDFEGWIQDVLVKEALEEISKINKIKIMGSYVSLNEENI